MDRVRELYQLYKEPIFRYFLRMTGDWEEAGELTQEVFFQACLSLYRFRNEASLKTWLFSISRNVYLKHLQKEKRNKILVFEEAQSALDELSTGDSDAPDEIVVCREEQARVRQGLAQLSENARTVIILKEYEQLSYEEIAKICGQSINWARVNFFRAKKQLGQIYRELEDGINELKRM